MHTSKIAGAMARTPRQAGGLCRIFSARNWGKENMMAAKRSPSTVKVASATRKSCCSCRARPLASASATRRLSATGKPAVARVKKMK